MTNADSGLTWKIGLMLLIGIAVVAGVNFSPGVQPCVREGTANGPCAWSGLTNAKTPLPVASRTQNTAEDVASSD